MKTQWYEAAPEMGSSDVEKICDMRRVVGGDKNVVSKEESQCCVW